MKSWRRALLGLALLGNSCRHAPPAETGASSFAFIEPPPAKPATVTPTQPTTDPIVAERFVEAEPIRPLTTPVYPAKALAAKAGLVTVGVRVTVSAEGRVVEVGPSMLTFSTPGRFAEDFQEAVRQAVAQWRFRPARLYKVRVYRMNEGGGPPKIIGQENAETSFDLSFTFTATGAVLSATPPN